MNYQLAKEIYGMTPWCVDAHTYPALMGMLRNLQNGVALEIPDVKLNTPQLLDISNASKIVTRPYQLDNNEDFNAIGLININGAITVSGGASSMGMRELSDQFRSMASDSRIKDFLVLGDSGGGSSIAVELMTDVINEVKQTKRVIGVIRKGGTAASAMYGIMSACSEIYAESEMSIVGSSGTMVQFQGREANTKDENGVKHIRLYASKSTHKNKFVEDALNKDDYTVIYTELLNPINERFLNLIESNRPILKGTNFDNGHTTFAKDAIGTFIDGIKSFDELVESMSTSIEQKQSELIINNNQNQETMTVSELQQNHPDTYNAIFKAGVTSEKERVGVWMAHFDTDNKTVIDGINSGEAISATQREELLVKATSANRLNELEQESPKNVITKEDKKTTKNDEVDSFYGEVDSNLKNLADAN